jgi:anti-anti-sigma factor
MRPSYRRGAVVRCSSELVRFMRGTRTLLFARGDVDLAQAERLRAAWFAELDEYEPDLVVIDLAQVTFMDVAGLRVVAGVVERQRARGGSVGVSNASPMIMRLLRVTELDARLEALEDLHVQL